MDCGTRPRLNFDWFKSVEGLNIACNSEKTEALAQTDSKITKVWKTTVIKTSLEKTPQYYCQGEDPTATSPFSPIWEEAETQMCKSAHGSEELA